MKNKVITYALIHSITFAVGFLAHATLFKKDSGIASRVQLNTHTVSTSNNDNSINEYIPSSVNKHTKAEHGSGSNLSQVSSLSKKDIQATTKHKTSGNFETRAHQLIKNRGDILSDAMLKVLIIQWAKQDILTALMFSNKNNLQESSTTIMAIAGKQGEKSILSWLSKQDSHANLSLWISTYFTHLAEGEAHKALQVATQMLQAEKLKIATEAVLNVLAKEDIYAVFAWLNKNENTAYHHELYYSAMQHYIEQAPWEASLEISSMPASDEKEKLIVSLANRLSKDDIYDAIDWAESLPPQHERKAIIRILENWAESDSPNSALDFLLSDKSLMRDQDSFQSTISSLAKNDRTLLINRLSEFPNYAKPAVIQRIAQEITSQGDTTEYDSWFNSLPRGGLRAAASLPVVEASLHSNPARAFTMAENIINPIQRAKHIEEVAKVWGTIDESQAKYAIMSSETLTEQQKSDIIQRLLN